MKVFFLSAVFFFSVSRFVGGFLDLCWFGLCNVHQKSSEEKAVIFGTNTNG